MRFTGFGTCTMRFTKMPGVFVQRIIRTTAEKRIEQRTVRKRPPAPAYGTGGEV